MASAETGHPLIWAILWHHDPRVPQGMPTSREIAEIGRPYR
jgi:hypothetical protein